MLTEPKRIAVEAKVGLAEDVGLNDGELVQCGD
jgi:hypothetical protein